MGKFDGKHLTGLIGNLISRKGNKGTIIQTAPNSIRQTEATKKESSIFGQGSILAAQIRYGLYQIIRSNYDGGMINRLNTPVKAVLRHCYNKTTNQFNFTEDSFSRLAGIEFNQKSLLINSLWVKPEMILSGTTIKISLPEIEIPAQLKFTGNANTCELSINLGFIILNQSLYKPSLTESLEISDTQQTLPVQEWTFEVPEGCLCIAGIGLNYYTLNHGIKTVLNNKDFNPANVIGAIITPGTFVDPGPTIFSPQHTRASEWRTIDRLQL